MPEDWSRRRKLGFPVPFSKWVKEDKYYNLVKEMFERDCTSQFFDKKVILKLLEDHHNGIANHGRKIYNIYTFLIWYDVYFGENSKWVN